MLIPLCNNNIVVPPGVTYEDTKCELNLSITLKKVDELLHNIECNESNDACNTNCLNAVVASPLLSPFDSNSYNGSPLPTIINVIIYLYYQYRHIPKEKKRDKVSFLRAT